ncbi:MAG: LLM class flavin-dependent oxidoreductase [Reyranella sp.]|nr:LLM class flavin-dependent oxidoreductase [Reyranella sp.]
MRQIEVGIFLPVGNNGYLMSTTSPQYMPTWALQRDLGEAAEALGYDFLFSMAKWRGFGGATRFWDFTLESVSVMTALAACTGRLRLIATMSPPLLHPVVAAKMAATIDHISGGRFGINIVTGSSLAEYEQMGVLPPGYDGYRYAYATEWLTVIKRLWAEPAVDFDGRFFHLRDCVLAPKPIQSPRPFLVCAGVSEEGFRFTAAETDCSFLTARTVADTRTLSSRMKQVAREQGRAIKTATPMLLIIGDSDAAAKAEHQRYLDGIDRDAVDNLYQLVGGSSRPSAKARYERTMSSAAFGGQVIAGSAETVADHIGYLVEGDGIDNILLMFPDYLLGIRIFAERVAPLLRQRGIAALGVTPPAVASDAPPRSGS